MGVEPLNGRLGRGISGINATNTEEEAWMFGRIELDSIDAERLGVIAQLIGLIVANPRKVAGRVCVEVGSAMRIGAQVVFNTGRATFLIIVTDQAIAGLVVLLEPQCPRAPVLDLGVIVVTGHRKEAEKNQAEANPS